MTPRPPSPGALATARGKIVESGLAAGWALTRSLPESVTATLLQAVGHVLWSRDGARVQQLEANLRRAVPDESDAELKQLSRQAMTSYFRYWNEVFQLPAWSNSRIVDSVVTANEAPLRAAMADGSGAIVALPHMANWDHAGAWACLTDMPVTTVAEVVRPESLFHRFVAYREALGMQVVPLTHGASTLTGLRAAVTAGRLVCLVADRDLGRTGVRVRLLGEPATLPPGPAVLSRVTGAPLFVATLSYTGPLLRIEFSDPVPARSGPAGLGEMTQRVADIFSAGIRRAPVDWHMLQPVFTADAAATRGGTGRRTVQLPP